MNLYSRFQVMSQRRFLSTWKKGCVKKILRSLIVIPQFLSLKHWKDDKTTISSNFVNLRVKLFFFVKEKIGFCFRFLSRLMGWWSFSIILENSLINMITVNQLLMIEWIDWFWLIEWPIFLMIVIDLLWLILINCNWLI